MTVGEPSDSGGRTALGSESERGVVRDLRAILEQHGAQVAVGREDDISQLADDALLLPDRLAAE
jgi:hypothetical protein